MVTILILLLFLSGWINDNWKIRWCSNFTSSRSRKEVWISVCCYGKQVLHSTSLNSCIPHIAAKDFKKLTRMQNETVLQIYDSTKRLLYLTYEEYRALQRSLITIKIFLVTFDCNIISNQICTYDKPRH